MHLLDVVLLLLEIEASLLGDGLNRLGPDVVINLICLGIGNLVPSFDRGWRDDDFDLIEDIDGQATHLGGMADHPGDDPQEVAAIESLQPDAIAEEWRLCRQARCVVGPGDVCAGKPFWGVVAVASGSQQCLENVEMIRCRFSPRRFHIVHALGDIEECPRLDALIIGRPSRWSVGYRIVCSIIHEGFDLLDACRIVLAHGSDGGLNRCPFAQIPAQLGRD